MEELHKEYIEWRSKDRSRHTWSFFEWLNVFAS